MKSIVLFLAIISTVNSYVFGSLGQRDVHAIRHQRSETGQLEVFCFPDNNSVPNLEDFSERRRTVDNPLDPSNISYQEDVRSDIARVRLGREEARDQGLVIPSPEVAQDVARVSASDRSKKKFELPSGWCCSAVCCVCIIVGVVVVAVECSDGSCI